MAENNGFGIIVYPIRTLDGKLYIDSSAGITDNEQRILTDIHGRINEKYVSSGAKKQLNKRLAGNLFFCCLESGAAMFSFLSDKAAVSMQGFYIAKSDLKTAWKLYIPYFIYLMSVGKCALNEAVRLNFEELRTGALNSISELSSSELACADEVIRKIRTHGTPFSFSSTRLPASMIPGGFENLAPQPDEDISDSMTSVIVFDPEAVAAANLKTISTNTEIMQMRLCRSSAKRFRELRKGEIKALCHKQYQKEMMKEIENADDSLEYVWYFNYSNKYYVPVDNETSRMIEAQGDMISFEVLFQQMEKAIQAVSYRSMAYQSGKPIPQAVHIESFEEVMARVDSQGVSRPYNAPNRTSCEMPTVSPANRSDDILPPIQPPAEQNVYTADDDSSQNEKRSHKGGFFGLFRKK